MLETLRLEHFSSRIGESFRIVPGADSESGDGTDSETVSLVLIEADGVGGTPGERPPFSLVFRAPPNTVVEQGIYCMHHEDLGELTLFLVPLGPDADDNIRCEAVFT